MRADAIRTAIVTAAATLFLTLVACTPAPLDFACATPDRPPIAVDPARCTASRESDEVTNGARWYRTIAADVAEPDERPVPGEPLDGDWWDPKEMADTDDKRKPVKAPPTKKSGPTKR